MHIIEWVLLLWEQLKKGFSALQTTVCIQEKLRSSESKKL